MTYLDIDVDPACLQGTVAVLAPGSEMLEILYPNCTEKAEDYYWSGVITTLEDLIELGADSFAFFLERSIATDLRGYLREETKVKIHCYILSPERVNDLTDEALEVWSMSTQHFGSLLEMLSQVTAVLLIQQPPQSQEILDLAAQCGASVIPCDPDQLIREIIQVDCFLSQYSS